MMMVMVVILMKIVIVVITILDKVLSVIKYKFILLSDWGWQVIELYHLF